MNANARISIWRLVDQTVTPKTHPIDRHLHRDTVLVLGSRPHADRRQRDYQVVRSYANLGTGCWVEPGTVFIALSSEVEAKLLAHALLQANRVPAIVGKHGPAARVRELDWVVMDYPGAEASLRLCQELFRQNARLIVVLGDDALPDPARFVEFGATDFVWRPIRFEEVVLRIWLHQRLRGENAPTGISSLAASPLTLDMRTSELFISDKKVRLRRAEARVFFLLAKAYPDPVSSGRILQVVSSGHATFGAVRNQIYELRKKLLADGRPDVIETMPAGHAYRLSCACRVCGTLREYCG